MSIIRDHILVDGSLSRADTVVAAAVFELAEMGFVTIRLATSRVSGVRVTRTAKSADELLLEQRLLLKSLFERGGKTASRVYLAELHKIPVAQTLVAQARALLVQDGSIRPLRPRTLYRRISTLFYAVVFLAIVVLIARFPQPEAIFFSLFGAAFAWVVFSSSTSGLKYRRVFRLPKSKAHFEMLDALRSHCKCYLYSSTIEITDKQLPYELLWQRFGVLRSVKSGYFKKSPEWFDGEVWPQDPEVLSARLRDSLVMMAGSLGQPLVGKATYEPDEEMQVELGEVVDKLGDGFIDTIGEMHELASDLGEWGGGDSSGGDGGGDGGSGDGGGDGGGGDG